MQTDSSNSIIQDSFNLNRFIIAQDAVYDTVVAELSDGCKRSHWMWYIFPQLKHLGHSYNAKFYGISGWEEAKAYLANPILDARLRKVSEIILALPEDDAREVFGGIDAIKLRSSMTLFDLVAPNDIFSRVLEKYFNGKRDRRTIAIVNEGDNNEYNESK
ncbi:MAG: DUF1810 domain-containing protein [Bacteroidales bacterium]|nr:DUF1810 domain-containing protein [Bacteroidales bacterium]